MASPARLINVLSMVAVLMVSGLANSLPLNGRTTAEAAHGYRSVFLPALYTFSMWNLIWVLLTGFCIYQLIRPRVGERVAMPFVSACFFNIAWIFLWHFGLFPLALGAALALSVSLAVTYSRLTPRPTAGHEYLWSVLPFSIYLGWVCVTLVVNTAAALQYVGLTPWAGAEYGWLVVTVAAAAAAAALVSLHHSDPVFPLAFIWFFFGLLTRHSAVLTVVNVTAAASFALVLVSLYVLARALGRAWIALR